MALLETAAAAGGAAFIVCHTLAGADLDAQLLSIARGWDEARYAINADDAQLTALRLLEVQDVVLIRDCPSDPRPRVWLGVILAGEADASDWLTALTRIGQARDILVRQASAALDDQTRAMLECTLGALYTQAPPFPVSIGDAHLAKQYLRAALRADPTGAEPNFYYGELLFREHRFSDAAHAFSAVLSAPPRPDREVGDKGLADDARARLAQIAQLSSPAKGAAH